MNKIPSNSRAPSINRPVIISAMIHIVLIVVFSIANGDISIFKDKDDAIDMVWVELPKGTSEEIDLGVPKASELPTSTIEEQKQFEPESVVKQEPLPPKVEPPPPPPPVEKMALQNQDDKKVDNKPKDTRKPDPNAKPPEKKLSSVDKKMKNALAMIDKDLTGRGKPTSIAQPDVEGQGYKYGTGDKPQRVSPSDPEYLRYQAMVRSKIIREWIVPSVYTDDGGKNFKSRIEVMINDSGEVLSASLAGRSGNESFDQSALRAVRKASPFPKPPEKLEWEAYNEGFLIEFDPRLKP